MPNFSSLPPSCTKSQAAEILYPDLSFDTALPQDWVNATLNETGFDVRPHFVWGYPQGMLFGKPYPVSQAGADWLEAHS